MQESYLYYYYGALGKKPDFELGMVVMTRGIKEKMVNDPAYYDEVDRCFDRYIHKDLGVLGEEGDDGCVYEVVDGEEIMGAYITSKGYIYISTSYDRKGTIIFLPEER